MAILDPTLADSEYLLVINKLPIDRFDIVTASETKMEKPKKSLNESLDSLAKQLVQKTMSSISTAKKLTGPTWKNTFKNSKRINYSQPILEKGFPEKKMELFRQMAADS